MGLNDDVQPPRTHETVSSRERNIERPHHFRDANGRATGNAYPAMNQGRRAVPTSTI